MKILTSPIPPVLHIRRVEKQASAADPPEQAVAPPYCKREGQRSASDGLKVELTSPGSLPPLTKLKPSGKKTEYESETFEAVVMSTAGWLGSAKLI